MPEVAAKAGAVVESATQAVEEKAGEAARAAQRLGDHLQERWQRVNERLRRASAQARAELPALQQELREDAEYVAVRARYYHETRPLSALGMVAAAAFALGMIVGLGRH